MRVRTLPRTDVTVSEVGFGVWTLAGGWRGDTDEREAVGLLRAALERGVTLYDTGEDGGGRPEALLARAFAGRREEVLYSVGIGGRADAWSPESVRAACERSLAGLGTDRIDVVRLHDPPARALRPDAALGAVADLVAAGTVRACVLSTAWSLLEPAGADRVSARARDAGLALMVRDPLCSGMLEAKYTPETAFPPGDPRGRRPREWLLDGLRATRALGFLTQERPQSLGQAALKWLLAEPLVAAVLPDVHGLAQLEEFAAAPDLPDLGEEDLARIEALRAEGFGTPVSSAG